MTTAGSLLWPAAAAAAAGAGAFAVCWQLFYKRLLRKARELETLHDVAATLSTSPPQMQTTLGAIVSIVAKYLEADLVAFLLLDESTGELVTQPGAYGLEGEELHYRLPLTQEESSSVRVFKSGRPFLTGDAQNDPGVVSRYAKLWKVHSLMVIPILLEGRTIGVMRLGSFRRGFFTQEHLQAMAVIADEAAVIVETAVLNRKLAETAEQLKAVNRMKDEIVSTVSHEFKTPLTTITGFATVLLDGQAGPLTPEQARFMTIVRDAAKRLGYLVTELLDLSKLEGGLQMDFREVALDELIGACAQRLRPQAQERGVALSWEVPKGLPPARADEKWIGLVVDNLLSNALKFSHRGGRVRVTARSKGDYLMVCVEDEGIGIPAGELELVFDKFYRAGNHKNSAPGTGLGLSIARSVVEKHGGRIWAESEAGRGSRFTFILSPSRRRADEDRRPEEAAA